MFASIPVTSSTSSVFVSSHGGFTRTFDTAYPHRLAGIISPEEYQASIQRINDSSKTVLGWLTRLIGGGMVLLGFGLIIYGGFGVGLAHGFPPIMFVGMGFFLVGGIFTVLTRRYILKMMVQRMHDAIAYENTQYSSRQCAWRFHATPAGAVVSNRGFAQIVYNYEIEIEFPRPEATGVMNLSVTNYAPQGYQPPAYMPPPAQPQPQPQPAAYQPPVNTHTQAYHPNQPLIPQNHDSQLLLCPGCQYKLKPEEKFCSQCGFRLNV